MCESTASNSVGRRQFVARVNEPSKRKTQLCSCLFCEETAESEANLFWLLIFIVLFAPFVWLMSECDALPIVPLSEPHNL